MKKDPSQILRDYNSFNNNVDEVSKIVDIELKETSSNLAAKPSIVSNLSFKQTKINHRSRSLTVTLFGVVAIFFICHFPAAIAKIIYVLYPTIEFEKSAFASICLDLSNFLIMCNSSINFLLYIVFGPAKFRQEFGFIFMKLFYLCKEKPTQNQNEFCQNNLTVDYRPKLTSNKTSLLVCKERSFSNYYSNENSVTEQSKQFYLDEKRPSQS
ncbi:unnamed protein product [Brachionus calyciflorus]|nr:unnamed protein product [Brachionus calyciflorus]